MLSAGRAVRLIIVALLIQVVNEVLFSAITPTPPPGDSIARLIPPLFFKIFVTLAVLIPAIIAQKDMSWPYLIAYIVPLVVWYNAWRGHYWPIIWLVFGVIPLLEIVTGEDTENPNEQEEQELLKRQDFAYITAIWVPFQALFLIWAIWAVSVWNLSVGNFVLFAISTGFVTGTLGINISHELIHKPTTHEKYLGRLLLAMVCYGHWYTEHLYGHHKQVSTPGDPATSKYGENFYAFWPRSVVGSFWSAWELEHERAKKRRLFLLFNEKPNC